ncbi:PQQ-dependent sugar dehydrogenase [Taibaiella koreensis]|uniref:PQQ-dependent sugar dehydrogenase n=1 Tax=Taibaiella koreensis TaxID=1268548 RepID=UPI000E59B081|nr:PQQ-dependent sugar dehydrogenase [Taibaiella koreensis]
MLAKHLQQYCLPASLLFCSLLPTTHAQQPVLQYTSAITGLTTPMDIVNAGDGSNRLFVVQRGGTIRVHNAALGYVRDFLTVTGIGTAGEGGLLSLAFHPSYATNGYLFVYYTLPNLDLQLARYQVSANADSVDAASKQVVLTIPHPTNSNHNGGRLLFGTDGYLYLGTGDGGGGGDVPNNAQNGNVLLGKMLRLNVTTTATAPFYTIPPGNPYTSDPNISDEIWNLGLRNPFRWSFDRGTGDMWIADVGQDAYEEVDFLPAASTGGHNLGWRCYEGNTAYKTAGCQAATAYTAPIFVYGHNSVTGGSSITGGHVYRGTEYPALAGTYICADYVSGNQWTIRPNGSGGWSTYQQDASAFPGGIVAFGEAEDGTLYAVSLNNNTIYKVVLSAVLPLSLRSFTGTYRNNTARLSWETAMEQSLDRFEIEYSQDGQQYRFTATVAAHNMPSTYGFDHFVPAEGKLFYRLKMIDQDGRYRYSDILTLNASGTSAALVYPTLIKDGWLYLSLPQDMSHMRLTAMNGVTVWQQNLAGLQGPQRFSLGALARGMYIVHLQGAGNTTQQKIILE